MFAKNTKQLNIDGIDLMITEVNKKKAFEIESIQDGNEKTSKAFMMMVLKPDGTPFFSDVSEVDDLPTHVFKVVGEAIKELNEPKN